MTSDEGTTNTMRIMLRYLTNRKIRRRTKTMEKFFKQHTDIFGYGIYTGQK